MGLYDRDYYQGNDHNLGANSERSMVVTLVAITAAIYLVDNLFPMNDSGPGWLAEYFAADAERPFEIWRLLTSGFMHSPMNAHRGIWHIVGNMFVLWMFGREIEGIYGKKEFLCLYLATITFGSAFWLCSSLVTGGTGTLMGASGGVAGIVLLFVFHFPKRQVRLLFPPIPMPAWVLGVVLIGMDALGAMGARGESNVAFTVHLAGAAFAFLYFRSGIRLTQLFGDGPSVIPKRKTKLRVHRDEERPTDLDRKADRILQKVHRDGADSITSAEQKILDDYSRRMRQKHSQK